MTGRRSVMEKRVCVKCQKEIPEDRGYAFILDKCWCIGCLAEKWDTKPEPLISEKEKKP